jgi:hypothetical protein
MRTEAAERALADASADPSLPESRRESAPAASATALPRAPSASPPSTATALGAREAMVTGRAGAAAPTLAPQGAVANFAAKSAAARALEGCWRTLTGAGADSVLRTPAILDNRGDTLVIATGAPARPARVVRLGDQLAGSMRDRDGRDVSFRASMEPCVPTPSPR